MAQDHNSPNAMIKEEQERIMAAQEKLPEHLSSSKPVLSLRSDTGREFKNFYLFRKLTHGYLTSGKWKDDASPKAEQGSAIAQLRPADSVSLDMNVEKNQPHEIPAVPPTLSSSTSDNATSEEKQEPNKDNLVSLPSASSAQDNTAAEEKQEADKKKKKNKKKKKKKQHDKVVTPHENEAVAPDPTFSEEEDDTPQDRRSASVPFAAPSENKQEITMPPFSSSQDSPEAIKKKDKARKKTMSLLYAKVSRRENITQLIENQSLEDLQILFRWENGKPILNLQGVSIEISNPTEYQVVTSFLFEFLLVEVGNRFKEDDRVEENVKEAVRWYRFGADRKYPSAECHLGLCYQRGCGVGKDINQAVRLYQSATRENSGFYGADLALGMCYTMGLGVPQNHRKAFDLYTKAIEYTHVVKMLLGTYYVKGLGGIKDEKYGLELILQAKTDLRRKVSFIDKILSELVWEVSNNLTDQLAASQSGKKDIANQQNALPPKPQSAAKTKQNVSQNTHHAGSLKPPSAPQGPARFAYDSTAEGRNNKANKDKHELSPL